MSFLLPMRWQSANLKMGPNFVDQRSSQHSPSAFVAPFPT